MDSNTNSGMEVKNEVVSNVNVNGYRYDAFISYRHSELDMEIAKKIHKGLETFRVPAAIVKKSGKKRINRVFRDQEELPIGSDLNDNIEGALKTSEYLIVICSPRTPESYWVMKEIDTYIALHGREHILAVLIEGEPEQSFPKQLLVDDNGNPVEPLAADVRGETEKARNTKLKTEIMRLAAPLLSCAYDDLRQRHRERRLKRIFGTISAATALVAVLGVSFGIYHAHQAKVIKEQADEIALQYTGKLENQSRFLASTSNQLLKSGDREDAVLVALEALPGEGNDRPFVADAQSALTDALYSYSLGQDMEMDRLLKADLPVVDIGYSDDQQYLWAEDSSDNAYLWNAKTGEEILMIPNQPNVLDEVGNCDLLSMCAYDNKLILINSNGAYAYNYDGSVAWKNESSEIVYRGYCDGRNGIAQYSDLRNMKVLSLVDGSIINSYSVGEEADVFSLACAFADNGRMAISRVVDEEQEHGYFDIVDLSKDSMMDVKTEYDFISGMFYYSEGVIVAVSSDSALLFEGADRLPVAVEAFDESGNRIWKQDSYCTSANPDSTGTCIKVRSYTDDLGTEHKEAIVSIDNHVTTYNLETGEIVSERYLNNGIRTLLVAASSGLGFLAEGNGYVDIVDLTTGKNYSEQQIVTNSSIMQIALGDGVMAIRNYGSPDIMLLSYHYGEGVEEVDSYPESPRCVLHTEDESMYAVSLDYDYKSFVIYDAENDEKIATYCPTVGDGDRVEVAGFNADGKLITMSNDGIMTVFDAKKQNEEIVDFSDESYFIRTHIMSHSGNVIALQSRDRIALYDTLAKKKISEMSIMDDKCVDANISCDENNFVAVTKEGKIYYSDISQIKDNSEITDLACIDDAIYTPCFSTREGLVQISNDGRYIAVCCIDNVLRIISTESKQCIGEIPFFCRSRLMTQFSEDCTKLFYQGDDYYLKVFDLEKCEICVDGKYQFPEIQKMTEYPDEGMIVVNTLSDIGLLDISSYDEFTHIEYAEDYLPEHKALYCLKYGELYKLPYKNLDALIEEAHEQFPNAELTELEMKKYLIK